MNSTHTIIKSAHVGGGSFNIDHGVWDVSSDETWVCSNGFTGV